MATIDIIGELDTWLATERVKNKLTEIVSAAVQDQLKALLREDLVDTSEAAKILGLSTSALRKRVERGQINTVRIGTSLRFRRSDLLHR